MIKDVIVSLSTGAKQTAAGDYAISLAKAFGAHVAGVAFALQPVVPATIMGGVPADFIDTQRAESDKAARAATARFESGAEAAFVAAETHVFEASITGAGDIFGHLARRFDLSIVGQEEPDTFGPQGVVAEAALFEAGRPVIVVPYIQRAGLKLDRVLVCWDASRAAARAVGDALPLLERAKEAHVMIVTGERGKRTELPGADMGQHLARHGIKVEVNRMAASDVDTASVILSYAADLSADFLVMGGYGHSRLREFVLGGVTRTILGSMTVPVLMSH